MSGRQVVIAPGRARRPGAGGAQIEEAAPDELESCPFCEGREDRTPPETLALPAREPPGSPGWSVRVVPNLYPAFERQEVVVHSPRHARSFADLTDEEIGLVARAWRARRDAESAGYLHALINEGRAAGASLAHSHSQLVWLPDEPPGAAEGHLGEVLTGELVAERDGVVVACPEASRVPYELVLAPREAEVDAWTSDLLTPALSLLADAIRKLHAVEGRVPLNAWLHTGRRWHIEVMPRLTVFAGIELGAGIYVNTLAPEEAARALREASPVVTAE